MGTPSAVETERDRRLMQRQARDTATRKKAETLGRLRNHFVDFFRRPDARNWDERVTWNTQNTGIARYLLSICYMLRNQSVVPQDLHEVYASGRLADAWGPFAISKDSHDPISLDQRHWVVWSQGMLRMALAVIAGAWMRTAVVFRQLVKQKDIYDPVEILREIEVSLREYVNREAAPDWNHKDVVKLFLPAQHGFRNWRLVASEEELIGRSNQTHRQTLVFCGESSRGMIRRKTTGNHPAVRARGMRRDGAWAAGGGSACAGCCHQPPAEGPCAPTVELDDTTDAHGAGAGSEPIQLEQPPSPGHRRSPIGEPGDPFAAPVGSHDGLATRLRCRQCAGGRGRRPRSNAAVAVKVR